MKNILFSSVLGLLLVASCKKDKAPAPPAPVDCSHLVASEDYGGSSVYQYTYDDAGHILGIVGADVQVTYEYFGFVDTDGDGFEDEDEPLKDSVRSTIVDIEPGQPNDTTVRTHLLSGGLAYRQVRRQSDGTTVNRDYLRDANGNIVKETYYDATGAVLISDSYEYDGDGNPVKVTVRDNAGVINFTKTYTYGPASPDNTIITGKVYWWPDPPKLPTKITTTSSSGSATVEDINYLLDSLGRVILKTTSNSSGGAATQVVYTYKC